MYVVYVILFSTFVYKLVYTKWNEFVLKKLAWRALGKENYEIISSKHKFMYKEWNM